MKTKTMALALVTTMLFGLLTSPIALAASDEQTMDGTVTVGNAVPNNMSVRVCEYSDNSDTTDITVYDNYCIQIHVRDNDTLADIENVILYAFRDNTTWDAADSTRDHYTFTYYHDNNDWSTGVYMPDDGTPGDNTLQEDNYTFNILLAKVAENTPSGTGWTFLAAAYDSNDNDSAEDSVGVALYIELALSNASIDFDGDAGDDNVAATENPTSCTVTSNYLFEIETKLENATWISGGDSMAVDNTKFYDSDAVASSTLYTNAYQDLVTGQNEGADQATNLYLWHTIPEAIPSGTYTNTFYVRAVTE